MPAWVLFATLVLVAVMIGALPSWAHMRRWDVGYFPSVAAGGLLLVLMILALAGQL
jgi:hypothetical protein